MRVKVLVEELLWPKQNLSVELKSIWKDSILEDKTGLLIVSVEAKTSPYWIWNLGPKIPWITIGPFPQTWSEVHLQGLQELTWLTRPQVSTTFFFLLSFGCVFGVTIYAESTTICLPSWANLCWKVNLLDANLLNLTSKLQESTQAGRLRGWGWIWRACDFNNLGEVTDLEE